MTQKDEQHFTLRELKSSRFCSEHQHNYARQLINSRYPYQQVYSWTNKYLTSGVDALQELVRKI
ncbi:hypothetical protein P7H25_09290 [Paenibacillus larvae]|nr:hypothetical protein [Paenibacillus larvae]MDT2255795.1 hypothetical protein [Paenibacillus larvae]